MPTYQYKCKSCEHRFDVTQRITEDPLTVCPECSGEIKRVLFPAGVVFKGSGWYVTDYRSDTEKAKYKSGESGATSSTEKKSDSDTKSSTASETKTETKSETKTESKSESKSDTSKSDSSASKAA